MSEIIGKIKQNIPRYTYVSDVKLRLLADIVEASRTYLERYAESSLLAHPGLEPSRLALIAAIEAYDVYEGTSVE